MAAGIIWLCSNKPDSSGESLKEFDMTKTVFALAYLASCL
jgi:hypothetical protein